MYQEKNLVINILWIRKIQKDFLQNKRQNQSRKISQSQPAIYIIENIKNSYCVQADPSVLGNSISKYSNCNSKIKHPKPD